MFFILCNSSHKLIKVSVIRCMFDNGIMGPVLQPIIFLQLQNLGVASNHVTWTRVTMTSDSHICLKKRADGKHSHSEQVSRRSPKLLVMPNVVHVLNLIRLCVRNVLSSSRLQADIAPHPHDKAPHPLLIMLLTHMILILLLTLMI